MSSWRDAAISELEAAPDHLTLILAADPDELLLEERMLQRIDELGFDLLTYDDPIAFRFAYESRYHTAPEPGRTATRHFPHPTPCPVTSTGTFAKPIRTTSSR